MTKHLIQYLRNNYCLQFGHYRPSHGCIQRCEGGKVNCLKCRALTRRVSDGWRHVIPEEEDRATLPG